MRAFYEGMSFRFSSQGMSEEQRQEWVLRRLRHIVRKTARDTDYYKEEFSRLGFDADSEFSFDDFAKLPSLERESIVDAGRNLMSQSIAPDQLRRDSTGGSTGIPTEVWLGPEERGWRESGLEYPMMRLGVPTGVRTAFFWGHHLDPVARDSWRERYHDFESNSRWFDCFRLSEDVLQRYHQEFQRWRPTCIVAYASALASLAEHLQEHGEKPNYPTGRLVTGAEKLTVEQRQIIEQVFGQPVHERYGSRDVGLMAFQYDVPHSMDLEVDWSNVLLEPETTDRESSILVTKLHADGMPMLRYRIGDLGIFPEDSKPGHPVFRLREVIGRDTGRIWLPDGRWIHGIQFPHMMKDYPVKEFMIFQASDYSVELKIVPRNGLSADLINQIHSTVSVNLPGLPLNVIVVEEVPRGRANKWQPVVSEVRLPVQEK